MGQNAHRGKTPISFFSNMTQQTYVLMTSDNFVASECLISVLKAKISRQDDTQSGLAEFTPIFM